MSYKFENLKGTRTEANLKAAYAGESQARVKYEYYASEAKKQAIPFFPTFLMRLPETRESTQKSGSRFCMTAAFRQPI